MTDSYMITIPEAERIAQCHGCTVQDRGHRLVVIRDGKVIGSTLIDTTTAVSTIARHAMTRILGDKQ